MMTRFITVCVLLCASGTTMGDHISNGIRPSNVLGGAEQHASFSFVRPGLTQTSYAFNGPSSHQSFSSSIGNPHLAQRVLPNVAHALAYRNPGLGYFSTGPISAGHASSPYAPSPSGAHANIAPQIPSVPPAYSYHQQTPLDQATALAYLNQYQYYQQQAQLQQQQNQQEHQRYPEISSYQAQLGQLLALRQQQAQLQLQGDAQHPQQAHGQTPARHIHETSQQQVPQQVQLHQEAQQQPSQSLLGVAYSSAPSVAHVKVTGNGYKFDF